jgi:predicted phage terminase large subunit-like protein
MEEMGLLMQRARNAVLREDFYSFVQKCFASLTPGVEFRPNWHIGLICEYLEACRKAEIRRLIINMPPRALKSVCVSVAWPAFLLGHNPGERIMAASYSAGLSIKHALDCRRILRMAWYRDAFPQTRLSAEQNQKQKFATTSYGYRIATSIGGTATGEGGNFLIMDDPQNPAQVMSQTRRQHAIDWFDHTFATRLDDKQRGVMVLVMQRLHDGDLSGYLLEKGGWEQLCLPAIAERPRLYRFGTVEKWREAGEVLHPAREDAAMLEQARRDLGSYAFAAQYQQNPMPIEAGMVKRHWFGRYGARPEVFERIVQSWDTAIKAGNAHDCSVCLTMGEVDGKHYVLDVQVLRAEYPELKRQVVRLAQSWEADAVLVEDKASGQSLLQDLRREKLGAPLIPIAPVQDKVTRFAAVSAMIEAGMVLLPHDATWLAEFEREVVTFPAGRHDDQVDALSQYLGWIRRKGGGGKWRIRMV